MLPPPTDPVRRPPPKPTVPTACIRKTEDLTQCGAEYNNRIEYTFQDPGYAVRNYSQSNFLRACPECVKRCIAKGIDGRLNLAPMSAQGLENDR